MATEHMAIAISIVSLVIAVAGFGVAVLSASYSRRQALAAEAQLRRKDPVFEMTVDESPRPDGWTLGYFTARNREPLSVDWIAVEFRNRRVEVLSERDAYFDYDNGLQTRRVIRDTLPVEKAGRLLNVGDRLSANQNGSSPIRPCIVRFVFRGPLKAKDVKHVWKWADE